MIENQNLFSLAKVLRSKNTGPFDLTLDVIFDDEKIYCMVKKSGIISKALVSKLYNVPEEDISVLVFYDPALAFKITMKRSVDSGSIGDTDVYGAQQHAPLMDILIPME